MRIPKPVNTVLDWAERQAGPLAAVIALVATAVSALWMPLLAGVILGIAIGGFAVHQRMGRRLARLRKEADDLLRENGALRHRNTVLSSGIITREAQMTQALVSIPEDNTDSTDSTEGSSGADPQRTFLLPTLPDEEVASSEAADEEEQREPKNDGGPGGDTADLTDTVDSRSHHHSRTKRRTRATRYQNRY